MQMRRKRRKRKWRRKKRLLLWDAIEGAEATPRVLLARMRWMKRRGEGG
jgi:hypothetical protein